MSDVLAFWVVCLLAGFVALPITFALLRRLPDAGAGLSFALGLAFAGYIYFILRVARILPFGRGGAVLALVLLALISCGVAGRTPRFGAILRRAWPGMVIAACMFSVFFFAYVGYRSYLPEITGTEQPMDLMYLNATMQSPTYPPEDPWLAGHNASYYYFGYLQGGLVSQIAGVPASTGYNLTLAYTFAAAATAIASLAFAIARWVMRRASRRWWMATAGVAVGFLLFLGTLEGVFELTAAHGDYNNGVYGTFGVDFLLPCTDAQVAAKDTNCYAGQANVSRTTHWYPDEYFFWFRGSRVIPDTITEFPAFSFLLGDLHPHLMSIPLVLLALALSAAAWRGRKRLDLQTHMRTPFYGLALAVLFGALAFQNAWDILTFTVFLGVAVAARNLRRAPPQEALIGTAGFLLPMVIAAVVLYAPWYVDFRSQAGGIYPYVGTGTRPVHAFLQFGVLGLAGLLSLTWAWRQVSRASLRDAAIVLASIPVLPFLLWLVLAAYHKDVGSAMDHRTAGSWITLAIYGGSAWVLASVAVALAMQRRAAAIVPALCALGAFLLYGTELFFIRDIFFSSTPRMNTVFKLSYQAWIVLSLGGAVALVLALREAVTRRVSLGWLSVPVGALACAGLVYVVIAIPNRTEGFSKSQGIDGLTTLAQSDAPEYALTRWVQQHVPPGDVVIEASGRQWGRDNKGNPVITDPNVDYTDAGSISARTGRPVPIGWFFHEIQWRGDTAANRTAFQLRQDLEDSVYTAATPQAAVEAMQKAGARYLVVGRLEQAKYPSMMPDFSQDMDIVFDDGGLRVYELPQSSTVDTS